MLSLKNAAGALRRNLTDTTRHLFSGPHRGWKIALYVTMLVVMEWTPPSERASMCKSGSASKHDHHRRRRHHERYYSRH